MAQRTFKSVRRRLSDDEKRRVKDGAAWASKHEAELSRAASVRQSELRTLTAVVTELKQARLDRGLSLSQVAERSGIDRSRLSKLESDPHPNPTLATLTRIARAIGVELTIAVRDVA